MSQVWEPVDEYIRCTLSSARAAKGYSWEDVSRKVAEMGWKISPGNLMTRYSRCSFRADELLLLMKALDIPTISTPTSTEQKIS